MVKAVTMKRCNLRYNIYSLNQDFVTNFVSYKVTLKLSFKLSKFESNFLSCEQSLLTHIRNCI